MKVKIVTGSCIENKINEFIKDKHVIDIKYQMCHNPQHSDIEKSALIMYKGYDAVDDMKDLTK